jgi:short-subunit dehydrogenase
MSPPAGGARLAVVTGASSGMGAELARQLSRAGRPVLAVARREGRLAALAAEAREAGQAAIHPLALDVTAPGAAARVREAARALGGAAWLVNDAGYGLYGAFERADPERLTAMVRLNCETLVAFTRTFLEDLRAAGRDGALLNIASAGAFQPLPFMAVYGATKAFVLSFTEALAEELGSAGPAVVAFCPGPVKTEFNEVAGVERRLYKSPHTDAPTAAREALEAVARRDVVAVSSPITNTFVAWGRLLPRAIHRRLARMILAPAERP